MELENKINLLKEKCSIYDSNEFLTYLAGLLLQISQREKNPFLKKLMSPMRQLFFLGLLNSQKTSSANKLQFTEEEWDEMSTLLHEIEMEYFFLLGFPKKGQETEEEIQKIKVTMPTFMNYFFNGPLSYQEQEIEKIENIFSDFDTYIEKNYNLTISDFINFYDLMNDEINKSLNKALKFANPEIWQEFTKTCVEKGLLDPKDWINEAPEEIHSLANFIKNPGSFLRLSFDKLDYSLLSKEKCLKIVDLFTFIKKPNNAITFYTEKNPLMDYPILRINEKEFLPFYLKQYLNALYNFLFDNCTKINKEKCLKSRDTFIENKVFELFSVFFGKEGFVYKNYMINDISNEQDILILYKGYALIIEVKAGSYRAPMRDPIKAFDKLKSDFKKIIQNAYDQTLRVKNAFYHNEFIKIKNEKKQILYNCKTKKYIDNLYSIIITLDRFGHIQTNLIEMLEIDDNDDFPWSVNIDDLEAFLLTLSKRKNRIQSFLTFLKYRENYHEHLICSDELELCGLFLKNEKIFKEWSLKEEIIATTGDLTKPIEESYSIGMGFKNERNFAMKQDKEVKKLYQ